MAFQRVEVRLGAAVFACIVAALCWIAAPGGIAVAATGAQDGLEASLTTDAPSYEAGKTIAVNATIKNTNDFPVYDITVEIAIPEGYKLTSGSSVISLANLPAGEVGKVALEMVSPAPAPKPAPGPAPTPGPINVKTGDEANVAIMLLFAAVSIAVMALIIHQSRSRRNVNKNVLPMLLLVVMGISLTLPASLASATVIVKRFTLNESITISGQQAKVSAAYTYSWDENKPVESIEVSPAEITLTEGVGQTQQLSALIKPADATNKDVTWTSSDDSVVAVDENGKVTGVAPGEVTITATTSDGGFEATCTVTVAGLVLEPTEAALTLNGGSQTLTARAYPSSAITWTSANSSIVSVSNGTITSGAVADTTTVTATLEGTDFSATCTVRVLPDGCRVDNIVGTTGDFYGGGNAGAASGAFEIPETVNGITIVGVAADSFSIGGSQKQGNTKITSVILPSTVTTIKSKAFTGCTAMTQISLPDSLESIERSAFSYCSGLTEMVVPNSVTFIGDYAFSEATALRRLVLPNNSDFTAIPAYMCFGPNEWGTPPLAPLENLVIPDSVTSIGDSAFSNTFLESIVIPDSVKTIGNNAFYGCAKLASVKLPNNSDFVLIPSYAFSMCSKLPSIDVPSSVEKVDSQAFFACSSLQGCVFNGAVPEGVNPFSSSSAVVIYYTDGAAVIDPDWLSLEKWCNKDVKPVSASGK